MGVLRKNKGCLHYCTLLLGGSWVVITRVLSRVAILIIHIRGLITPRITTHEPPSTNLLPKALSPVILPLVSREWKNGSNGSYNCTPFLHSLLTKGKPRPSEGLGRANPKP